MGVDERGLSVDPLPMSPDADLDSLWDFADPAKSEARFRERLSAIPADQPAAAAETLTQLSRACSLQRRHAEAGEFLEQAAARWPADDRVRIRILLEHGRLLNEQGRSGEAASDFQRAWDLASSLNEGVLALDAAHMLGYILTGEASETWHRKAILLSEGSTEPRARRWQYRLLCNLGQKLVDRGDFAAALECFEKASRFAIKESLPVERQLEARWRVAQAIRRQGRTLEAMNLLNRILEELPPNDTDILGYVCEDLAECHSAFGHPEEAKRLFARAYELHRRDPWFPPDGKVRLERIRRLAGAGSRRQRLS
jgi:tetratricopeptide (TPR) repeat protein